VAVGESVIDGGGFSGLLVSSQGTVDPGIFESVFES